MGWDGMGWDGMGWDGMGWDGIHLSLILPTPTWSLQEAPLAVLITNIIMKVTLRAKCWFTDRHNFVLIYLFSNLPVL